MRYIIIIAMLFCHADFIMAQSFTQDDLLGVWSLKIDDDTEEFAKVIFSKLKIEFLSDGRATFALSEDHLGTWKFDQDSIRIDTRDFPNSTLYDCMGETCQWKIDKEISITIKKGAPDDTAHLNAQYIPLKVAPKDIIGHWIWTHIKNTRESDEVNILLFGNSALNHDFIVREDGTFYGEGYLNDAIYNAKWRLLGDSIVQFEYAPDDLVNCHVLVATPDSLVLINKLDTEGAQENPARIMYIYTKEIGLGLREYLFEADSLINFDKYDYPFSFKLPTGTEISTSNYSSKGESSRATPRLRFDQSKSSHDLFGSNLSNYKKSEHITVAKLIKSHKEDWVHERSVFTSKLRQRIVDNDNFVITEHVGISHTGTFSFYHVFEYDDTIYEFEGDFRYRQNVDVLYESLKNKVFH